ncbi:MAG TPA: hypothetical protein PL151_19140 [Phycisphaerae bacterium]|nr:hypothetical protein [Phycisphaerae bacterium]HOJ75036.1 hypothetical protein [Phycisphaerae bacterium]HOM51907.1 hypothetical protein [Phycisphaerae bacterium]HON65665.1 hypothetical protein [Phycisphaerae bacterium]HOQ88123.1 hypothetical protein [Phycisphaerae bacterium]
MMRINGTRQTGGAVGWLLPPLVLSLLASTAMAGNPRWMLVYYRQTGNHVNAGNHTIENHVFREDGTKAANVGLTNLSNPHTAIFGYTNADGWNRVDTLVGTLYYDLMIYRPGTATDHTPNFYWHNPAQNKFYSFVTHWMYVSDDARVYTYPQTPVYHYDRVSGINSPQLVEPPGASSDSWSLSTWADYQAQTFVVPPGINRIVSAQAYVMRELNTHFQYRATIRAGGPDGPAVGPAAISRCVVAIEFFPVQVNWPINAVPVTPGQTYALRLEPILNAPICAESTTPTGFTAYATNADNYAGGMLYNGPTPVPGRDLLAIVVGVGYDIPPVNPAVISLSPQTIEREVMFRQALTPDTVRITNDGGAPLNFTNSTGAAWLNCNTANGRLEPGAGQNVAINYDVAGLAPGTYTSNLTVVDPFAANSPQVVQVRVTVTPPPFAPVDFDQDHDVDQEDFGRFQACYTGEGIPQNLPECAGARLDADNDVDQADFEIFFTRCLSGPGKPADTACNS